MDKKDLVLAALEKLNPQQYQAATTTSGNILVLAGAGSGKTSVLITRIAYLITVKGIDPSSIVALTFTNKAAKEMRQRIALLLDKKTSKAVTLSTFHSYCFSILSQEIHHLGYRSAFSVYDEKDVKRLLTQVVSETLEHDSELPSLEKTHGALTSFRTVGSAAFEKFKSKPGFSDFITTIASEYTNALRACNAVDFESMLELTHTLLTKNRDIALKYQTKIQYVMIDEYQDTSPLQYEIAMALTKQSNNLFVVGDDDQSIYSWRGASIEQILTFPYDTLIKLEQNYRSTDTILDAANAVIKKNITRHEKTLWTKSESKQPITVFAAPDEQKEADGVVARIIHSMQTHNYQYNDFAIMYRSNHLTKPLEVALLRATYYKNGTLHKGIPYNVMGGKELYDRSEVKDIVCYLRVLFNEDDTEALLRIINYPRRGISTKTLDYLREISVRNSATMWETLHAIASNSVDLDITCKAKRGILDFVELIYILRDAFSTEWHSSLFLWLIEKIAYRATIEKESKTEKGASFRMQSIDAINSLFTTYIESNNTHSLHEFTSLFTLDSHNKNNDNKDENAVTLLTFHSSKGLEFPVCFIIGAEETLLPHEKCTSDTAIEEERRLFYVALTRAKHKLTLSMAQNRKKHGTQSSTTPSRFIHEIPSTLYDVTPYDKVYNG